MEKIVLINKKHKKAYKEIIKKYKELVPEETYQLMKLIIINFKKYSNNEYYIIVALLIGLVYFDFLDINDPSIGEKERELILQMYDTYKYETTGEKDNYIESILILNNDMFILKMIMKYTIITYQEKTKTLYIDSNNSYFESIGYTIPLLTLKESKLLGFFQDQYFQHVYPEEYNQTKELYLKQINDVMTPGKCIINIIDSLNDVMEEASVIGRTQIRKKSYFSIYNKYKRKINYKGIDSIGARIIFSNIFQLNRFVRTFESKFVYEKKKDYIKKPKPNGYKSIHYTYTTPFRGSEIYVELQLRTLKMDTKINHDEEISHFTYTLKKNKWAKNFKEVHYGYEYMMKYYEKK